MAALVQSLPSPSSTMTMLQTRPTSSEAFQGGTQGQQHQRNPQMPRNIYNTSIGGLGTGNYRGHTPMSPVAPYAFTSTPVVPNGPNPLRQHPTTPHLRQDNRTSSAPIVPLSQQMNSATNYNRPRPAAPASAPLDAPAAYPSSQQQGGSKDDTSLSNLGPKSNTPRPLSSYANAVAKPSPDRYRRNHRRPETGGFPSAGSQIASGSAPPSGSGMATVGHLYNNPSQTHSTPSLSSYSSYRSPQPSSHTSNDGSSGRSRLSSVDDMSVPRQSNSDSAKRYRRRSISSLEAKDFPPLASEPNAQNQAQQKTYAAMLASPAPQEKAETRNPPSLQRPSSAHGRHNSNNSAESSQSGRSGSRPPSVSASLRFCRELQCFVMFRS